MDFADQEKLHNDWENRIGYHKPTKDIIPMHVDVRSRILDLGHWLIDTLPDGREKSLALTHLQEASMWSNAAIACNMSPLALGE